jgi:hypothetical protein
LGICIKLVQKKFSCGVASFLVWIGLEVAILWRGLALPLPRPKAGPPLTHFDGRAKGKAQGELMWDEFDKMIK